MPRALVVALRVDAERGDRRATFIKTAHAIALKGKGTLMSGHDRRRLLYADLGCVEGLPVERNPGRASPPAWGTLRRSGPPEHICHALGPAGERGHCMGCSTVMRGGSVAARLISRIASSIAGLNWGCSFLTARRKAACRTGWTACHATIDAGSLRSSVTGGP